MGLIAHRANNNHEYQENTIDAVIDCLNKSYIAGVEIDVRLTKDKKVVIAHDMTINRVSDGSGFVGNMTLNELKKYNFGNKKHKSLIVTLDDLLKVIHTPKKIFIEVKSELGDYKPLVNQTIKIINKYKQLNIYVMSFNQEAIKYFKQHSPNIKGGIIFLLASNLKKDYTFCDFFCISYLQFGKLKTDKDIVIWGINSIDIYKKVKNKIGNQDIITDKAYLLEPYF